MSWIFGYYSKLPFSTEDIGKFHPQADARIHTDNFYIAAGGNARSLLYSKEENEIPFFVCGVGISENVDRFLKKDDWRKILAGFPDTLNKLNGHFCGVFAGDGSLNLFTDSLGTRSLYILENERGYYFCTRQDLLFKIEYSEIDFSVFSTKWLLTSQLENKNFVKGIYRLNCGSTAKINGAGCKITVNGSLPKATSQISGEEFVEKLKSFVLLGLKQGIDTSLSFSGGFDSRFLFSLLLNSGYRNWSCHTCYNGASQDSLISRQITYDYGIRHDFFSEDDADPKEIKDDLFEFIGSTSITVSAYTTRLLRYYKYLNKNELVIDGGFAEIWRRTFLNYFYYQGRAHLQSGNYQGIADILKFGRADIFNEGIASEMKAGVLRQLEEITAMLPDFRTIGIENWLDLFILKTRYINIFAVEQSRIDNFVMAYMPFAQPALLGDLLNLPLKDKRNGALFKKHLYKHSVDLTKYGLAKGEIAFPFHYSTVMRKIHYFVYSAFHRAKSNTDLDIFLAKMKEFIMDSLLSSDAKEYAPYNYPEIHRKVISYYDGELRFGNYVDWFLTFEIFRQIMKGKI